MYQYFSRIIIIITSIYYPDQKVCSEVWHPYPVSENTSSNMHDTGYSINSVSLNLLQMNIVYPIWGIPFICIHADTNVCRSA